MSEETDIEKQCKEEGCEKPAKPHWDMGLYCGDDLCDDHFTIMVHECRMRSW